MRYERAQKQAIKGRFIFAGTAGAGRIRAALEMASGLTDGKIAVLDTESGMAKIHSNLGHYDVLEMAPPFTADKFIAAVEMAEKESYNVLIIDTLSQAWAGEGGILEQVGKLTASKGSKNGVWDTVQPQHDEMMTRIKRSNLHILVILQCKTEYFVSDQPGGLAPKKIGLNPIQRDGIDYGFHAVFYVDEPSHVATCSADHTGLFGGGFADILTRSHGEKLRDWLENGLTPVQQEEKPAAASSDPNGATALFISALQAKVLSALITDTKSDKAKFLDHFKVEKLDNFPAARYEQACTMLEAKKAQGPESPNKDNPDQTGNLAEMLKNRGIPFTDGDGGLFAKPSFSDNAAKAFLRENGFTWDATKKAWSIKQAA